LKHELTSRRQVCETALLALVTNCSSTMEKQMKGPSGPLVHDAPTSNGVDDAPAPSVTGDSNSETSGKSHEFNEQTNYVPKRTIITVSSANEAQRPS